jgi:serine/threonine-protein kinase
MGTVWVATNLVLERKVAIKVLHGEARNDLAEARLLREARAAAQIGHTNIVQVFDFGHTDLGEPYIVMELLRGEDLSVRLARVGRLAAADAVKLLLPVTSALAAGHAKGIVHRDMKPGNVFIAIDDVGNEIPKVVDFGIAKVQTPQYTPKLTVEGRVVGSPEYLSPEQARGEDDLDATTDVWALCVTLYETLTGNIPFRDENYNRLLRRIIEDPPRPITDYAAGDAALWSIISRGLCKHRRARWASMEELGRAMEEWLEQRGVEDIPRVRFASLSRVAQDFPAHPPASSNRSNTTDDGEDAEPTILKLPPPVPGPAPSLPSQELSVPLPGLTVPSSVNASPLPVHRDPSPSRVEAPPVYGDLHGSGSSLSKLPSRQLQLAVMIVGGFIIGVTAVVLIAIAVTRLSSDEHPSRESMASVSDSSPMPMQTSSIQIPPVVAEPAETQGPEPSVTMTAGLDAAPAPSPPMPSTTALSSSTTTPSGRPPRPIRNWTTSSPPIPKDPNF